MSLAGTVVRCAGAGSTTFGADDGWSAPCRVRSSVYDHGAWHNCRWISVSGESNRRRAYLYSYWRLVQEVHERDELAGGCACEIESARARHVRNFQFRVIGIRSSLPLKQNCRHRASSALIDTLKSQSLFSTGNDRYTGVDLR